MARLRIPLEPRALARTDQLLLERLRELAPALSRARLKEAFRAGAIRIDGRRADPSELLAPGRYEAVLAEGWDPVAEASEEARASEEGAFLPVVHEDDDLLVLDKATGVPSIPHSAAETRTAVGAALARCPSLRGVGRAGLEPGILHRLDTGTSGLLVFAKHDDEFQRLTRAWKSGVRKTYRALAHGTEPLPRMPVTLTPRLAHDSRSSRRMIAVDERTRASAIRGKPLDTLTRLIRARETRDTGALATASLHDLEIEIETGVMHQIRCTLAWLGFPILGDPIYGGIESPRLWLHAWRLELPARNGGILELEAPLPKNWTTLADVRAKC